MADRTVVEVVRLKPTEGVSEADFLAAGDTFEQDYMRHRPGFIRRTLLRGDDGDWRCSWTGQRPKTPKRQWRPSHKTKRPRISTLCSTRRRSR